MICDEYICCGIYISEDQMKTHSLLVAVKNVTWYEFRPRFEREERGERGEEDLMASKALLCFLELISFSFLFFWFRKISSSLKGQNFVHNSTQQHILSLKIKCNYNNNNNKNERTRRISSQLWLLFASIFSGRVLVS